MVKEIIWSDGQSIGNEVGLADLSNDVEMTTFVGWAEAVEVIKQWAEEEH